MVWCVCVYIYFLLCVSSGSRQERGLVEWRSLSSSSSSYDLPLGMGVVRRTRWLRRFPISPSFTGFQASDDPPLPEEVVEGRGRGGEEEEAADINLASTKVWLWCHQLTEQESNLWCDVTCFILKHLMKWNPRSHFNYNQTSSIQSQRFYSCETMMKNYRMELWSVRNYVYVFQVMFVIDC